MKLTAVTAMTIALLSGTVTSAAGASASWTVKDMKAAVRALGYPKPHPTKLACRGKTMYRCVATYRHGRRVFYAQWQSMGGWLCAGKKASICTLLRHGFVPTADTGGSLPGAAQFAARGYMTIHYNDPQPVVSSPCPQSSAPSTWTFCYKLDVGSISVNITLKRVKTGYVTTGGAVMSP